MKLNCFLGFIRKKTKKCPCCGEIKPVSEFYKNRSRKDGLADECKVCSKIYKERYKGRLKSLILAQARFKEPSLFSDPCLPKIEKSKSLADYQDKELFDELEKRGYLKID